MYTATAVVFTRRKNSPPHPSPYVWHLLAIHQLREGPVQVADGFEVPGNLVELIEPLLVLLQTVVLHGHR